jgi:molybdopterin-containing oxidoreductase family iron-sulfur binding subunit
MDAVGKAGLEFRVGQQGRPGTLIRETSLQRHRQDPHEVHASFHSPKPAPMFDPPSPLNSPSAWGMSIDLNKCIGCNGCVIACQSENNVPIVGKANVLINREMHWLRIDRYFKGEIDSPDVVHVPMACAHCENAPCEQVCPVAATVHDTEGLNAMVYNRCIGTRYCANNCPYKVRRFNYLDYHSSRPKAPVQPWLNVPDKQPGSEIPELVQMGFNPDVSVRMRGVMEKCTYCVQRISGARIKARNDYANGQRSSPIPVDGEVVTACQQACPTNAIQFGDLNDKKSVVFQSHHDDRAYEMLEELNIKPRTRYLARIRNVATEPVEKSPERRGS